MTNKIDTIPILYSPGGYGTFIEWCVRYFSGDKDVFELPFNKNGSSHKKHKNVLVYGIRGWRKYRDPISTNAIVRLHPVTRPDDKLDDNLKEIINSCHKNVLIDSMALPMLTINNKFDKTCVFSGGWINRQQGLRQNLLGWGAETYDGMAIWEKRDFLSIFLMPQHLSETKFNVSSLPENVMLLSIVDLFENFELTILSLLEYYHLSPVRTNFKEIYDVWRPLQIHYGKDQLVTEIVDATINDKYIEWSSLSLADEAIIQWQLRDLHKLDMLCYNVNVFPTNTNDLRKILINV